MTSLVFVTGILLCLQFVSYSHIEGKIIEPPGGNIFVGNPGSNVTIDWSFDDDVTQVFSRSWSFVPSDGTPTETLATISDDDKPKIRSTIFPFVISKPGTLILTNVSARYNGTYYFTLFAHRFFTSVVTVDIAARPTVTINCSSQMIVNENSDVRCLCRSEDGNPPANVTWYKDGIQIGVEGDEEKMLTLINVDKTASGMYKCVAQSYTLTDEISIEVFVYYTVPPAVISLTSTPEKAIIGKTVVITCEAIAVPVPRYTIIHNDTVVSDEKTHIIDVVRYSHAGSYKCIAKNKFGNISKNYHLSVVETRTTNAPNIKICATEEAVCSISKGGAEWYRIVVSLLSGIIIGIFLSYIFVYSRRRCRNTKPQSNPEPEISKIDSIYQDLDLSKMSSEDNYQSLRVNSAINDKDYENDSTYTELSKGRDDENNYQALTNV